jgi:hypothetical protein
METAKKALDIDMRLLGRICWPMLMASMKTKRLAEQSWICKIFEEMTSKHGSLLGIERRLKGIMRKVLRRYNKPSRNLPTSSPLFPIKLRSPVMIMKGSVHNLSQIIFSITLSCY